MKISGLHIDGFGIFNDQPLSDLGRNLVLFHGRNEAGKSTLLGFIRSVLFGFPRANARDAAYPPLRGGVHGGRIDLATVTGDTWSVSRKPGKSGGTVTVTGADNQIHDTAMLQTLLGGISYDAFKTIMAFGLTELQAMETLSGENVTGAIYGAGLGTSMNAMPTALKQVRKRMDELFKNRGKNLVINRIAGELDQVRKEIQECGRQVETYDATVDALSGTEKELGDIREKLGESRRELRRYEALERLWPDWITFSESRQALSQLPPPVADFPEEGLELIEKLALRREQCETALRDLNLRCGQVSNQLSRLPVNEKLLALAPDIGYLMENRNGFLDNTAALPLLLRDKGTLQDKVHRLLSRLGGGWSEAAVVEFDRSLFTRDAIRAHQGSLDALGQKLGAAEILLQDKKAVLDQAADARMQAEKALADAGVPPARNPEPLRKLKEGRDRFRDTLLEHDPLTQDYGKASEELSRMQSALGKKPGGMKWPAFFILLAGAAAAGLLFYFHKMPQAILPLAAVPIALLAVWVHQRQQRQLYMSRQELCRRQALRTEELSQRLRQLASVQQEYRQWAEASGVDTAETSGDALGTAVDRLFATLSEEEQRREAVGLARQRLDEKKSVETAARQAMDKAAHNLDQLKAQQTKTADDWKAACQKLGLDSTLSPETALEALDVMEEILDTLQQRDRCLAEETRLKTELEGYRERARWVLSEMSWPEAGDGELPRIVNDLVGRLEESRGNQREAETLGRQATDLEKERSAGQMDLAIIGEDLRSLLEQSGMPDEAAFQKTGRLERRRAELESAARLSEGNMRRISGEMDTTSLKTLLEARSLPEISTRKEAAEETARGLDTDLSNLYARRAEQKQALESLTSNEEISRLRAREAALLADLSENAREWSRNALAEHLISQARDIYERKHQPDIIKDAGDIFSRMTNGKYQGVVSPLGENIIEAVNEKGDRIPPGHLSRGTGEQLYLAVRFSYIRHQARKGDPLPVIMDDILVNFDPDRARKAAEAIRDLSASHQVLFFTCHPETVRLFQEMDPELPVFTLDGGRLFPPEQFPVQEQSSGL
jgi:uncharacterized protein YhaN